MAARHDGVNAAIRLEPTPQKPRRALSAEAPPPAEEPLARISRAARAFGDGRWRLEMVPVAGRSSTLTFPTLGAAVAHARRNRLRYTVRYGLP